MPIRSIQLSQELQRRLVRLQVQFQQDSLRYSLRWLVRLHQQQKDRERLVGFLE